MNSTNEISIAPLKYAYIRDGKYADTNWREINAELHIDTNTAEPLALKNAADEPSFSRKIFITFDLGGLKVFNFNKVFLSPSWCLMQSGQHRVNVYDLKDADYVDSTITWNNAPLISGEPLVADRPADHLFTYDLTAAVNDALSAGRSLLTVAIVGCAVTSAQAHMNPKTTVLIATTSDSISALKTDLLEDNEKNAAIWENAKKAVDEWKVHYNRLLKEGLYTPEEIRSDISEFDKTVYTSGTGFGNHTIESVSKPQDTRTYSSLKGLGEFTDYNNYPEDIYGGWMNPDMRREATGFFRTEKINGRFFVIDPLGYPCLLRTLKGVQTYQVRSKRQREIALEKYGTDQNFYNKTVGYIKHDLGFNAATGDENLLKVEDGVISERSMAFARWYGIERGLDNATAGSSTFSQNNTMPVFDPEFLEFSEKHAQRDACFTENPWILGYTTDNELPMDENMLFNYLALSPDTVINGNYVNHHSYAAAWTWLKEMTGKEFPSVDDIDNDMMQLFRGFVWDRYFSVVTPIMKKYHPNHMILGTRFLTDVTRAPWVLRFASLYIDVLTVNWYGQWTPSEDDLYNLSKYSGLPIYVTEFYVKALYNDGGYDHPDVPLTNKNGAGWVVRTQADRGDFYQNFVLRLLECKEAIGWQWIGYQDNDDSPEAIYKNGVDASGGMIGLDGVDVNRGIVNNWHEPYVELCERIAELNKNVYRVALHFDAKYKK